MIHGNAGDSILVGESLPLSKLRSVPAYVLLGDPGAGKTTEFRRECEASRASGGTCPLRDGQGLHQHLTLTRIAIGSSS